MQRQAFIFTIFVLMVGCMTTTNNPANADTTGAANANATNTMHSTGASATASNATTNATADLARFNKTTTDNANATPGTAVATGSSNGSTPALAAFNPSVKEANTTQNATNASAEEFFPKPNPNASLSAYYFWSRACPYSLDTNPFIDELERNWSALSIVRIDILMNWPAFELYTRFADAYNLSNDSRVVPVVFINGTSISTNYTIKEKLAGIVAACLRSKNCSSPLAPLNLTG